MQGSNESLARHRPLLEGFLQQCDFVKFAGASLAMADLEAVFQSARKFVLETGEAAAPVNDNGRDLSAGRGTAELSGSGPTPASLITPTVSTSGGRPPGA
jgi:hypothetical protein